MDKFRFIALTGFALLAFGCRNSDNTLHVKDNLIWVGVPRQFPPNTTPFAISRDGSKVAVFSGFQEVEGLNDYKGEIDLRVLDSKTFTPLGKTLRQEDLRGITFDATGTHLLVGQNEKYVAWDYMTGTLEPVADEVPDIAPVNPWDAFANLDHSILYLRPGASSFYHQPDPNATEGSDGRVLAGSRFYPIPFTHTLGFDPFGDFWFFAQGQWTKISRDGVKSAPSAAPKFLVTDHTKAFGTLHLAITKSEMKYKDAVAKVQSIWLTDDRATPDPVNRQTHYKAALVFTGSDIFDYGFMPHQRMIYVVTATGSYLIGYEFQSDAERAKRLREMREGTGAPRGLSGPPR